MGVADAVGAGNPVLVGHLVQLGIHALTADRLERVAPHLTFGEEGMGREDAAELVGLLLHDSSLERGWRNAIQGEILFQQNAVDHVLTGGDTSSLGLTGPIGRLGIAVSARSSGVTMAEVMAPMLPLAEPDRLPREAVAQIEQRIISTVTSPGELMASILLPSLDRAVHVNYRARNTRSRAAVALAIAMYRQGRGRVAGVAGRPGAGTTCRACRWMRSPRTRWFSTTQTAASSGPSARTASTMAASAKRTAGTRTRT